MSGAPHLLQPLWCLHSNFPFASLLLTPPPPPTPPPPAIRNINTSCDDILVRATLVTQASQPSIKPQKLYRKNGLLPILPTPPIRHRITYVFLNSVVLHSLRGITTIHDFSTYNLSVKLNSNTHSHKTMWNKRTHICGQTAHSYISRMSITQIKFQHWLLCNPITHPSSSANQASLNCRFLFHFPKFKRTRCPIIFSLSISNESSRRPTGAHIYHVSYAALALPIFTTHHPTCYYWPDSIF